MAEAARDLLAAALSAPGGPRLVEREALDAILAEDPLAVRLGATRAVRGTVARTEDGWRFVLTVLSVPAGAVLDTVDVAGGDRDLAATAAAAAEGVARALISGAEPRSLRADPAALASLHYLRGLGYLRAGLTLEAVGELLEARRLAVRFPETRFFMAKAWLAAREPEHATIEARAFLAEAPDHALAEEARRILEAAAALTPAPAPQAVESPAAEPAAPEPGDEASSLLGLLERGPEAAAPEAGERLLPLYPTLPAARRDEALAVFGRVARGRDEARLVVAVRLLLRLRPDRAAAVLREIAPDSSLSPACRAEALRLVSQWTTWGPSRPDLTDVLLPLLDAESAILRRQALALVGWHEDPGVRRRIAARAKELLLSRRHPEDAPELARRVDWKEEEDGREVAEAMLRSPAGGERTAGRTILAAIDPEAAQAAAWAQIDDPDETVRTTALVDLSRSRAEPGGFERLLAKWEEFIRPGDRRPDLRRTVSCYLAALRAMAEREMELGPGASAPSSPGAEDGPAAWRRWREFWKGRRDALAPLMAAFPAAGEAERERLLLAMGDTGGPGLLWWFARLDPPVQAAMKDAWRRALVRYSLSLGMSDPAPAPAAEDPGNYALLRRIEERLRAFRPWQE